VFLEHPQLALQHRPKSPDIDLFLRPESLDPPNQPVEATEAAVRHHGLNGLQVYPFSSLEATEIKQSERNFMGVTLVETEINAEVATGTPVGASNPSAAAVYAQQLFRDIVVQSAKLAGISGNLYRLLSEYRVTERRSRALENVILPEIGQELSRM